MSNDYSNLDQQINEALLRTDDPGKPQTLILSPPPPDTTGLYRLPIELRHLYMLADSIATKADVDPTNILETDEKSIYLILDLIDTHLEKLDSRFKNCFTIIFCEDWIVVPFSKDEIEMLEDALELGLISDEFCALNRSIH